MMNQSRRENKVFQNWNKFKMCFTGNAAVEFAIIIPILLLLFFASIDFGTVIFEKVYLRSAVNAGIAYAIGVSSTPAAVQSAITNATPLTNLTTSVSQFCQCSDNSSVSCTGTCTGGVSPDKYVQINTQVSVTLTGIYSFLPNPYTITENATVMVNK